MMAYPAVNSLIQTLELFQSAYPALIHGQTIEMINSLRASAEYFQNILENTSHHKHEYEKIKDLEGDIRTAVQQAEDMLESNIAELMIGWSSQQEEKNNPESRRSIQEEATVLLWDLAPVIGNVKKIKKKLISSCLVEFYRKIRRSCEGKIFFPKFLSGSSEYLVVSDTYGIGAAKEHFLESGDSSSSKRTSTTLLQDVTVGIDDSLREITDRLFGSAPEREVIPISGVGGCGKTTLAKKALNDPSIKSRFDINAWVTISQEYHLREVMLSLVSSVTERETNQEMSNDQLMEKARRALLGRKYLIIIDDIWSTEIWDLIARTLPDDGNGSRIILTTRLRDVAKYVNPDIHEIMPLSLDESWRLLCNNLIGAENEFPSQLEETGKQIVGKCHGLPLAILVVAGHLSKVPMIKESWAAVAKNVCEVVKRYPDKCLAVLAMSYHHLPIHLKPCFLHFGLFPEDSDINVWKLIRLWVAEGFLKCDRLKSPEEVANDCLENLISRNLIMVRRRKSNGLIKTCGIHDLLRDLSVSEAQKEKFFDVARINQVPNFSATNYTSSRHSLHSRIFLENFSMSSKGIRSLYLFEETHEPTGETLEFKALRVLAAIPMPYYFFFRHRITLDSAILRYLEVVSEHYFIDFLAYMHNLQTLIFYQRHQENHMPRFINLPSHIWNLKRLRYLRFGQCICLPSPQAISSTNEEDSISDLGLRHLQHLSLLRLASCTKEVLSCLTNLKKLRIDNVGYDYQGRGSLCNLVYLNKLESLFLWLGDGFDLRDVPLARWCSFPISLKRLTMRGGGLPWKDMATVAMLPNLQVLKLRSYAFTGEAWRLNEKDQFKELKLLLLESVVIKQWEASSVNFPNLQRLAFSGMLWGLKRIPITFAEICTLESIELYGYDNRDLEKSAREIQEEVASMAAYLHVRVFQQDYKDLKRRV